MQRRAFDLSSAHRGTELPALSRVGQPEVPPTERALHHCLSRVSLRLVFSELSISPEAFLDHPQ